MTQRTPKAICSDVCGARCCKWSFIDLTREEFELLPRLADELHIPQPEIVEYVKDGETAWVMHSTPCTFLSKGNLCTIYKDRPQHCRDFPDTWREYCPLSMYLFDERTGLPRIQESDLPKPRRRGGRASG